MAIPARVDLSIVVKPSYQLCCFANVTLMLLSMEANKAMDMLSLMPKDMLNGSCADRMVSLVSFMIFVSNSLRQDTLSSTSVSVTFLI